MYEQLERWLHTTAPEAITAKDKNTGFRLALFPDGGGKIRVIGIGNWLTQGFLFPVHKGIFRYLRKLQDDYTFDQGRIRLTYARWMREGRRIYSLDLTAATDRIPVSIQLALLYTTLG